jgi:Tol biopolymer transport system component
VFGGRLSGGQEGVFVYDLASEMLEFKDQSFFSAQFARPYWDAEGQGFYYPHINQEGSRSRLSYLDIDSEERTDLFDLRSGSAVISPDGARFAVTTRDRKAGTYRLLVRDRETGNERLLLEGRRPNRIGTTPHWTPDGERIAFWRVDSETQEAHLWSIRADGTGLQETELTARDVDITNLEELSIHPDGKRVAYSAGKVRFEIWALEGVLPSRDTSD